MSVEINAGAFHVVRLAQNDLVHLLSVLQFLLGSLLEALGSCTLSISAAAVVDASELICRMTSVSITNLYSRFAQLRLIGGSMQISLDEAFTNTDSEKF